MDFDNMSLAQLFAAADQIGDKYLSPEEVTERDRALQEIISEVNEMIGLDEE